MSDGEISTSERLQTIEIGGSAGSDYQGKTLFAELGPPENGKNQVPYFFILRNNMFSEDN